MSQKVLVVEDDINIAELLRLYLQKDGFEVSHAADGGKAVEMAKEIQPDLVLLDIMLPVMDGWQVCRELRKTMKMPIIMLTAKGETEDKVSGLEMGADDYIVKPFEVKELLARVHAVLRRTEEEVSSGPEDHDDHSRRVGADHRLVLCVRGARTGLCSLRRSRTARQRDDPTGRCGR